MDQKKIGIFLKTLRKESGVTQERLAEALRVSNRTVSRWETGYNMPDLDLLIQLADYYDVEISEILDGERKNGNMNNEIKETALKMADYSNAEKSRFTKRLCLMFTAGLLCFTAYIAMYLSGIADTFADGLVSGFLLGIAYGTMIMCVLYTSGHLAKLRAVKMRLLGK